MWSDDDDDLEFAAAAMYESESDHDVEDSDVETFLYSQVYHVEVKDDEPRRPSIIRRAAAAAASQNKVNSIFMKPDVNHRLPKVALDDGDSIYAAKLRPAVDDVKAKTQRRRRNVSKAEKTKAEVNDVTPPDAGEVVITIKRSEARSRLMKSAALKPSSSSSDDDDDDGVDVVQALDVSGIYAHLSGKVRGSESKRKSSPSADGQKRKSKKQKVKEEKVKKEVVKIKSSIDSVELQATCLKAMVDFYTTMSETEADGPTPSAKGRASKWKILSDDRRGGPRQTKGRFFMKCALCKESGHLVESCPQARKEPRCRLCGENHLMSCCENRLCSICWKPWHPIPHCPLHPGNGEGQVGCCICRRYGHVSDQCSDNWRKFHSTVDQPSSSDNRMSASDGHELKPFREASCYNCGRRGHFGHECSAWRMNLNLVPFFPFVTGYNRDQGSERRQDRDDGQSGSTHKRHSKNWKKFHGKDDKRCRKSKKSAKHDRAGRSKKAAKLKKNKRGPDSERRFKEKKRR